VKTISSSIPILEVYENAIRGTGTKAVMLCANNYPAKLAQNYGIDNLFQFNSLLVERDGPRLVELSDDWVEFAHLLNPAGFIASSRLDQITDMAAKNGLYLLAAGTGAQYSYAHHKKLGMGFFDFPEQAQRHYLQIYKAYADMHEALGLQLFTGHRVATLNEQFIKCKTVLSNMPFVMEGFPAVELGDIDYPELTGSDQVTLSEIMNMALALVLNRQNPGMLQLVEQMQYHGMEPCTVEQVVRFNQFLSTNLQKSYYADMADNGHVGVRGTRISNNPADYDLFEYAKAYRGPIVFIHHNILFENRKEPGTTANLERDRNASQKTIPAKDMPFPDRIRDINDYVIETLRNPNVELVIVSPEPKCDSQTDLERLADLVAEATQITKGKIEGTGLFEESKIIPLIYLTKGKRIKFDDELKKHIN